MVGQFHDRHRAILCRASRQPSCGTRARRLCHKTAFLSPHCSTLCLATIALSCNAHIASSITLPPPSAISSTLLTRRERSSRGHNTRSPGLHRPFRFHTTAVVRPSWRTTCPRFFLPPHRHPKNNTQLHHDTETGIQLRPVAYPCQYVRNHLLPWQQLTRPGTAMTIASIYMPRWVSFDAVSLLLPCFHVCAVDTADHRR